MTTKALFPPSSIATVILITYHQTAVLRLR